MAKYTNKQLHEAYSIEYYAHKQTQEALKQECRAHALTRRKLLEQSSEIVLKEVGSEWRDFIELKMVEYGSEYNKDDFDVFFALKHILVFAFKDYRPIAFGCVVQFDGKMAMCYSWNDGTMTGKKGYLKGINYFLNKYPNCIYAENGQRILGRRLSHEETL